MYHEAEARHERVARHERTRRRRRRVVLTPYWFMLPALTVLFIFIGIPMGYAFWLSFHAYQWNMPNLGVRFVGLDNYLDILGNTRLLASVSWTVTFTLVVVAVQFFLGLGMAILVNTRVLGRLRGAVRGLLLIPMMLSGIVAGFMWRMLFDAEYGPVNHLFTLFGASPVRWFSEPLAARISVIVADVWLATPFIMLVLLAGMQSIPDELYEAARIDGASASQLFSRITLPLLRYPILIVLVIRTMDALRVFDLVYIMTRGGPGYSTSTVMLYTYRYAFEYYQMGRTAAISFVFLFVLAAITALYMRLLQRSDVA